MSNQNFGQSKLFTIKLEDLEQTWNFQASKRFAAKFHNSNLIYQEINLEEFNELVLKFLNTLDSNIGKAGNHAFAKWENGWNENVIDFKKLSRIENLVPKYFGKIPILRWKRKWIKPVEKSMEYRFFELLLDQILEKYLQGIDNIYEFGCGTGHNLLRIRELYPQINIFGLDWTESSQLAVNLIAKKFGDSKLIGKNFNYFEPDLSFKIKDNSTILTVASLEQVGSNFKPFIQYLLRNNPSLVIHIEPIDELLDENNLLDYLSLKYCQKRDYLSGLLTYLIELQENVELLESSRTYVGSFYIEGYMLVVWRPKKFAQKF